jgi:hypothetical protein
LVSLATHGDDQLSVDPMFVEIREISPHFSDLQTREYCSRYREKDDEMKILDQRFIMLYSQTKIKQSVFSIEIFEGNKKLYYFQLIDLMNKQVGYRFSTGFQIINRKGLMNPCPILKAQGLSGSWKPHREVPIPVGARC